MGYEITVSDSGRYIIVRVTGSLDTHIANKYTVDARDLSQEKGIPRFLFDVRDATNVQSAFANYTFARSDMRRHSLSPTARSAILAREGDSSHDLVESFVQQAGYNVRLFRDLCEAEAWLEETEA